MNVNLIYPYLNGFLHFAFISLANLLALAITSTPFGGSINLLSIVNCHWSRVGRRPYSCSNDVITPRAFNYRNEKCYTCI